MTILEPSSQLTFLPEDECWRRLGDAELGRLALVTPDGPDIVPLNFRMHQHVLYFRGRDQSALLAAGLGERVAVQIDAWNAFHAWQVVVKGVIEMVEDPDEFTKAHELGLIPWAPDVRWVMLRLVPETIAGIRFDPKV